MVKINKPAAKAAPTVKVAAKPAAAGPKIAVAKGAKPGKGKAVAVPKETGPTHKVGQEVTFKGYANPGDEPLFEVGQRLTITAVAKDADNKKFYQAVASEDYAEFGTNPEAVAGDEVYPSEIEKAEKVVVDVYAIKVSASDKLTEMLADYDNDPFAAAVATLESINENYFYFGGLLATLYAGQEFRKYGEYADEVVDGVTKSGTGWERFCQDNFDMNGRKATGLIRMYNNMAGLLNAEQLANISRNKKIGWVKLDYMSGVVTADNVDELLELAADANVHDFRDAIRNDYVDAPTEGGATKTGTLRVKRVTVKAAFFEDQAEGINYVLETAKKMLNLDTMEAVLEHIIIEWGTDHLTPADAEKARKKKRAKIKTLKAAGADVTELTKADALLQTYLTRDAEGEEAEVEAGE